jgi:hypothetical protein
MLVINVPLTLLFSYKAIAAYRAYIGKLTRGELRRR